MKLLIQQMKQCFMHCSSGSFLATMFSIAVSHSVNELPLKKMHIFNVISGSYTKQRLPCTVLTSTDCRKLTSARIGWSQCHNEKNKLYGNGTNDRKLQISKITYTHTYGFKCLIYFHKKAKNSKIWRNSTKIETTY